MNNDIYNLPEDVVLSVRGVSKKFCRNLKRSMLYGMQDLARNMLGMRQPKMTSDESSVMSESQHIAHHLPLFTTDLRPSEFWALQDINFELRKGECLGLIGRNGSGKTTLLRLLSGIFPPDSGEVTIRGRMGALISLGAGFHPHMTGRENIYLNGTILGLTRKEIELQFDEILNFADIGPFIDAPVATYSSGMVVRLGFAVASATNPDLLLIDEVLAVGDISFRAKCYRRIGQLRSKAAVVFVSHSMDQIGQFCSSVMMLSSGKIIHNGSTDLGVRLYQDSCQSGQGKEIHEECNYPVTFGECALENATIQHGESFILYCKIESLNELKGCSLRVVFYDQSSIVAAEWNSRFLEQNIVLTSGPNRLKVDVKSLQLRPGRYEISVVLNDATGVALPFLSFKKHAIQVTGKAGGNAQYLLR